MMKRQETLRSGWSAAGLRLGLVGMILLISACETTTVAGDAGCAYYGEARLEMPRPLGDGPLDVWVAETDTGMTGTCR